MHNIAENLSNFTRTSDLYCVWVQVQDDGRGRLAAIWVDRAMTAFTADGTGAAEVQAILTSSGRQNVLLEQIVSRLSLEAGVSGADPLTFLATLVVFAIIILAACVVPARRASRVDPMEALRHE